MPDEKERFEVGVWRF